MNNKTKSNLNKNKEIINKYLSLDKKDEIFIVILKIIQFLIMVELKIIKPNITDECYMNISLINKENKLNIPIYRLVCEYFNKKTNDNDNIVNHINEIKYDNYYKNLEWVNFDH